MRITLIGAGNVGYHLGKRLYKKDFCIHQVYSRNVENARKLAQKIRAKPTNDLATINSESAIYIIAVKDDAIGLVAAQLAKNDGLTDKLIVHTSGAVPSAILAPYFKNYGVFYPLQTFSKSRKIRFSNIPICIDATREDALETLQELGKKISKKVCCINDEERAILHVAAVFVNNFTNHLFHIGQDIVEKEGIAFDLLKPLIWETLSKIESGTPKTMQTGPARRGDIKTQEKHLKYLKRFPEYAQLYDLLTKSIQNAYRR